MLNKRYLLALHISKLSSYPLLDILKPHVVNENDIGNGSPT